MSEPIATQSCPSDCPLGKSLYLASRSLAAIGGFVLVAVTVMSVASILSRTLTGSPLLGDYELVQLGSAIAVAAFLPWGQMRGTHVFVDFFTTGVGPRARELLDAGGALLLGMCAAVVAWRMVIGMGDLRASGETSMLLGVPTWYAYAAMSPSFMLLAATGLYTAWIKCRGERA